MTLDETIGFPQGFSPATQHATYQALRVRNTQTTLDETIVFPQGFLWGAATAGHQVEGGNWNNDWWAWEQAPGRIVDGSRSGAAAGWWAGRAEDDLRRAAALGHNAHRLSLEWSRLEPSPGVWDESAFARYRQILGTLRELGMVSLVTMNHFTLPQWAARAGGWRWAGLPERFARFAAACVQRLGDGVDWWATLNEPMILVYMAYAGRRWPPGSGSLRAAAKAAIHQMQAHSLAFQAAKELAPDAPIGIVLNVPAFDPATRSPLDGLATRLQDGAMSGWLLRALEGAADWLGLNFYGRHVVRFDATQPGALFGRHIQQGIRSERGDWGEVYPAGLTRGLLRLASFGKPLFVTENGIFDNHDIRRPAYLLRHLRATHDALRQGADVRGYFHWSLVDNFEWAEGWSTRFGLIELDPITQQRRPRPSAHLYEQVIRANGISPELWAATVRDV